jgi:formamidopyrimidine-DNA glycosylase
MPELPEVESARRAAHVIAAGRRIIDVLVTDDPIVFEGASPERIRRAVLGRRVRAVRRHGKHFWFELDRRPWLSVHFGMAGGLHTSRQSAVRLVSSGRRVEPGWPPRFTKLRLGLTGGHELAIVDGRRLGRIRLRHDPASEPPISGLGFDALEGLPSPARFRALARARTSAVKALLLDQSFSAGVGNWIADEVLYQARIPPRRRVRLLSDADLDRLRQRLRAVVGLAVRVGADSDRFPRAWLFHRRWDRRPGVTRHGDPIRRETIAGRTTAWVPAVQR